MISLLFELNEVKELVDELIHNSNWKLLEGFIQLLKFFVGFK